MTAATLNVAAWIPASAVNGPGERFVVWLQGCPLRCAGCWNPGFWDFAPRLLVDPAELARRILSTPRIEGITLTGGEPMSQAAVLPGLLEPLRDAGLSVMLFTGYRKEELVWKAAKRVLTLTDLAVFGRYVASERADALVWRGSRNQRIELLSNRYRPSDVDAAVVGMEVHIGPGGGMVVTGFPPVAADAADGM